MKYTFSICLLCVFLIQAYSQETISLWGDETPPFYIENDIQEYEKVMWGTKCSFDITEPELTIYPAEGENSGKAVIVVPGGGYELVALYHEGDDIAKLLAEAGITAIVLKYRLPLEKTSEKPYLAPIHDFEKALEVVKGKAEKYDFNPDQIGVMGFSAGAHLGATASILSEIKPAFALLIYGKFRSLNPSKTPDNDNLSLETMTASDFEGMDLIPRINEDTPPTFLTHSIDDDICPYEESVDYVAKLKEHGIASELHLFADGGHGYGIGRKGGSTMQWLDLAINWIKRLK